MNALFKKLNFKSQSEVYVEHAPASFRSVLDQWRALTTLHDSLARAKAVTFALAFTTRQREVDRFAECIAKVSSGDAVIWVAYPKGTSKNLTCEFNRDTGWHRFGAHGFEPVRQVAIDTDWSALRFRRVEHIKTMTRTFAITQAGREKARAATARPGKTKIKSIA
jgi:hypothetical protein